MTICVYHNRTLYADRAGVAVSRPSFFIEVKKLFISKCSRLAIAISGPTVKLDKDFDKFLSLLVKTVKEQDHLNKDIRIDGKISDFLENRTVILITNRAAFASGDGNFKPLDLTIPCATGSGFDYAMIALMSGKEPLEAMRISSCVDPVSFLTDVDSVSMDELRD